MKARLGWIKLYKEKQDFVYVCRRCGISRPTLRKWYKLYLEKGTEGLADRSKRPKNSPNKKLNETYNVRPIKKLKREKRYKRYQRDIPGERVQIDTCKIAPGIYQYTAIDDCSRWRVMELYKRRTAANTLEFIRYYD